MCNQVLADSIWLIGKLITPLMIDFDFCVLLNPILYYTSVALKSCSHTSLIQSEF